MVADVGELGERIEQRGNKVQLNSTTGGQQVSWLVRIGFFPTLLWGYVVLLFFMIGDGGASRGICRRI